MTTTEMSRAKDRAHDRLLNAVNTYIGADQGGSKAEIRAAVVELHAARHASQNLLFPPERAA